MANRTNTKPRPLELKQQAFVEYYLIYWNATEAARRAGYSQKTANEQGSRLLANVSVRAAVQARMKTLAMSADEVILRLAQHARGSVEAFLDGDEISVTAARNNGALHLIKKLKVTKRTETMKDREPIVTVTTEIEAHDAQAALVHIGRHLKLFSDVVAIETWRDKVISALRRGDLSPATVQAELGDDLATELFVAAGVPVGQGRETAQTHQHPNNYRSALAALAPRSVADSDPSGETEIRGDGPALGQDDDGG